MGVPVTQDPKTKKWRIGTGPAIYQDKDTADRAYKGYLARKHGNKGVRYGHKEVDS